MMKRGTQRGGLVLLASLGVITLFMIVGVCLMVSPVLADTRWFDPISLTSSTGAGNMEVVLEVTPSVAPGPYEYVYWVTNNTSASLTDFYFTCMGVPATSFDPTYFAVYDGTRYVEDGSVKFYWDSSNLVWGSVISGALPPLTTEESIDGVTSTRFRWSSLSPYNSMPLYGLQPGASLGYSFISYYAPATVAHDLAAGLAAHAYNNAEYAYGPGTQPDVPEWPAVAMALSGLGSLGVLRRRFRR